LNSGTLVFRRSPNGVGCTHWIPWPWAQLSWRA
jgi:hypothetical protein